MINRRQLKALAKEHGTPLFVVDHDELRRNYATFKKYLPRVQAYYAVKANSDPAIVKTLFDAGASFDVASMPEFRIVYKYIKDMPDKQRQDWIWDKIIYANPIKANETLQELNPYKPLVTYDNYEEIKKSRSTHRMQVWLCASKSEHWRDGRTVVKVRRVTGRSRGLDSRRGQGGSGC